AARVHERHEARRREVRQRGRRPAAPHRGGRTAAVAAARGHSPDVPAARGDRRGCRVSAQQLKLIAVALAALLLAWGASELFSRGSAPVAGPLALPAPPPRRPGTP